MVSPMQATVNTSCWYKKLYQLVMEITNYNDQPLQNSRQKSVFWREAECHCQVAEFLLYKNKK